MVPPGTDAGKDGRDRGAYSAVGRRPARDRPPPDDPARPRVAVVSRLLGGDDPGTRSVVGSLIAGVFLGGVGAGVAFPTIPALGGVLGISPLLVGLILSVNRFTRLVTNTPAGQVLDTMGTRRPMIAGFLIQGLAPFGYALGLDPGPVPLSSATVFFLSRAAWGIGSAFVIVGAFSTVTHVTTPADRGRWVGYLRGGQSMGFPAGLIVGGLVADAAGYAVAFVVAGVAGMAAATVAALVLPDVSPEMGDRARLGEIPGLVGADARVLAVSVVNFAVRFLYAGVLLSTVVLYAARNGIAVGGLSGTGVSGVVMAASVLAASVTTVLVGRYSDRLSNRAALTVPALAVLGVGFAVLALAPGLEPMLVGVALIGVGVGGSNPPLLAYLGDISPADDVGKLGGVYNTFGDLGSTLGPLVALPAADAVGFTLGYGACVALVVAVAALVARTLTASAAPVEAEAV